ncbi:hypothetical protein RJ640_025568 [Escallonia rubra]|uniref:Uncharacterized protein n=1 Tax=Escallonia rubra TaxID=112253 RepID=A0AA88QDH7_9ASTE|nr:hypothetical protein RJ640_025568 [Escallonia rubra]
MANSKGPSSIRSMPFNGKHPLLPPKSPFPSISPSYVDYVPTPAVGPKGIPKPRDGNSHHQRTSSESFLIEEQPSWLDELLNEPETPVRRGHRRSSSDSFAYMDAAANAAANVDYASQDEYKVKNLPSWGSQEFDHYKDARHTSFYAEPNALRKHKNRGWDPSNIMASSSGLLSARDSFVLQSSVSSCTPQEADGVPSMATEKHDTVESGPYDAKAPSERKDSSCAKTFASETDTKRAKQYLQVSKVRWATNKPQEAEGSEVSAELEFLNQQNIILSMENKTLKQRLESLAEEKLIKYLEHEVLEREIGRLRGLYQQQPQQQQQQPSSGLRRTKSRDLDSQFANLSLKHKEAGSGRDAVSGPLHI